METIHLAKALHSDSVRERGRAWCGVLFANNDASLKVRTVHWTEYRAVTCVHCHSAIFNGEVPTLPNMRAQMLKPQDWQLALDVQDAVNSRGLLRTLLTIMDRLDKTPHDGGIGGTDFINQHPIVRLFLMKLMDLARCDVNMPQFAIAYDIVKDEVRNLRIQEECEKPTPYGT